MRAPGSLEVVSDAAAVARALADAIVATGRAAAAERGAFRIALSGGNTPRAAYELLALEPAIEELSWSDVFVYFGDERCVGPDDELSNYRMARKAFLDAVPIPPRNVHRIRGEIEPAQAAAEYAGTLRTDLGAALQFDLVLLGLGPDGHTASLFSPQHLQKSRGHLAIAVQRPDGMQGISVTPDFLANVTEPLFVVAGSGKHDAIAAFIAQDPNLVALRAVAGCNRVELWIERASEEAASSESK